MYIMVLMYDGANYEALVLLFFPYLGTLFLFRYMFGTIPQCGGSTLLLATYSPMYSFFVCCEIRVLLLLFLNVFLIS